MGREDRRGRGLYRRLLLLFPFEFRREFGSEMTDVFEAQRSEARASGAGATRRLWLETISGFVRVAPRERVAILRQDVVYALRTLRATPTFTAAAVLALALGLGANVAVFSLVEAVLLNPLPVHEPSRLVTVQVVDQQNPGYTPLSTDNFRDLRDEQESFTGVAAFAFAGVRLAAAELEPQELFALAVSGDYFGVLGVPATIGRPIGPDDDVAAGAHPVVVLSHGLWSRALGADRGVVGRSVGLNGHPFTVIGVAPPYFRGTLATFQPDVYIPLAMYDTVAPGTPWFAGRRWRWLTVLARLRPGTILEEADAATRVFGDRLAEAYPDVNRGRSLSVLPLAQAAVNPNQYGTLARGGAMLSAVVAVVLLVACVNLANLLLARAAARAREVAVRAALGASRARLVSQFLTESLLLGLGGGVAGLALAYWIQRWLWESRPANLVNPGVELSIGGEVLVFALALAVVTGVLFGLVPALQISRTDVMTTLKEGGRQPAFGGRRRLRSALVVAEVALSVVALAAAGLLVRSLREAQRIDAGFQSERLLRLNYNLRGGGYDDARSRLFHEGVIEALRATPGVRAAAVATRGPLSGGGANTINVAGKAPPPGALGFLVQMGWVTPGYLETTGIALLRGRDFGSGDRLDAPLVGIVNETMARRFWPDREPLGERFTSSALPAPVEIVGVARDSKYVTLGEDPQPFFYLSLPQSQAGQGAPMALLVATAGPPAAMLPAVRDAVATFDPAIPLTNAATGEELLHVALWAPRMAATLVSAFGVLALALAAVGIYGVMAYTVSQDRQEIGLRMALGATPQGVLAMVIGRGVRLAGAGAALGIAVALAAAGTLTSLLYGVSSRDPLTFVAAPAGLVLVALLACFLPARRAARLDPLVALRE